MKATLIGAAVLALGLASAAHATTFSRGSSTLKIVGAGQEGIYVYDTDDSFLMFDLSPYGTGTIIGPGCAPSEYATGAVECPSAGITKISVQLSTTVDGEHDVLFVLGNQVYSKLTTIQIQGGKGHTAIGQLAGLIGVQLNAVGQPAPLPNVTSFSVTVPKGSTVRLP